MDSNTQITKINTNSLSQNRAEEFGFDLLNDFVLPPIFEDIDFQKSAKPKIFVGGRGCGKTMLLRYLSHRTSFSQFKNVISPNSFDNLGLYWKVDTHLVHQLQKRSLDIETWKYAFEHIFTIYFSIELLESMISIAKSNYEGLSQDDLEKLNLNFMRELGYNLPIKFKELRIELDRKIVEFQIWLRNIKKKERPEFYPKDFLNHLASFFIAENTFFENTNFK